jgi:hypothetical protein
MSDKKPGPPGGAARRTSVGSASKPAPEAKPGQLKPKPGMKPGHNVDLTLKTTTDTNPGHSVMKAPRASTEVKGQSSTKARRSSIGTAPSANQPARSDHPGVTTRRSSIGAASKANASQILGAGGENATFLISARDGTVGTPSGPLKPSSPEAAGTPLQQRGDKRNRTLDTSGTP